MCRWNGAQFVEHRAGLERPARPAKEKHDDHDVGDAGDLLRDKKADFEEDDVGRWGCFCCVLFLVVLLLLLNFFCQIFHQRKNDRNAAEGEPEATDDRREEATDAHFFVFYFEKSFRILKYLNGNDPPQTFCSVIV